MFGAHISEQAQVFDGLMLMLQTGEETGRVTLHSLPMDLSKRGSGRRSGLSLTRGHIKMVTGAGRDYPSPSFSSQ